MPIFQSKKIKYKFFRKQNDLELSYIFSSFNWAAISYRLDYDVTKFSNTILNSSAETKLKRKLAGIFKKKQY